MRAAPGKVLLSNGVRFFGAFHQPRFVEHAELAETPVYRTSDTSRGSVWIDVTILMPLVENGNDRVPLLEFSDLFTNLDDHASTIRHGNDGVFVSKGECTLQFSQLDQQCLGLNGALSIASYLSNSTVAVVEGDGLKLDHDFIGTNRRKRRFSQVHPPHVFLRVVNDPLLHHGGRHWI